MQEIISLMKAADRSYFGYTSSSIFGTKDNVRNCHKCRAKDLSKVEANKV